MSYCYPENEEALYYVEFERTEKKRTATLFKRQWMYPKEKWEKIKIDQERVGGIALAIMTNEMHPWNIFTINYGLPGSMPDEAWVRWMVDCLNLASDVSDVPDYPTGCELDKIDLPPDLTDNTVPYQTDGGGIILKEIDFLEYPRDGEETA